jgi:hypothetical protein
MGTTTTNLALYKPDGTEFVLRVTDLNDNWDKIDAAVGITFCTSATRPSTGLTNGRLIYETDTTAFLIYRLSTTAWIYLTTPVVANNTARDALTPVYNGMLSVTLDTNTLWQRKSAAWSIATVRFDDPRAEIYQSSSQNITNNSFTAVQYQSEDFDLPGTGGHDNSTNNTRYTAPVAGKYTFSGCVAFSANATGLRGCKWMKNGGDLFGSTIMLSSVGAGAATRIPALTKGINLAAGDYVELHAYQSSGSTLALFASGADTSTMHVKMDSI